MNESHLDLIGGINARLADAKRKDEEEAAAGGVRHFHEWGEVLARIREAPAPNQIVHEPEVHDMGYTDFSRSRGIQPDYDSLRVPMGRPRGNVPSSRCRGVIEAPRRTRIAWGRVVAALSVAGALALLAVALGGCSSPVTHERLRHLQDAIVDEHRATVARPGFEAVVASLRVHELASIGAMVSATAPR